MLPRVADLPTCPLLPRVASLPIWKFIAGAGRPIWTGSLAWRATCLYAGLLAGLKSSMLIYMRMHLAAWAVQMRAGDRRPHSPLAKPLVYLCMHAAIWALQLYAGDHSWPRMSLCCCRWLWALASRSPTFCRHH